MPYLLCRQTIICHYCILMLTNHHLATCKQLLFCSLLKYSYIFSISRHADTFIVYTRTFSIRYTPDMIDSNRA